MTRPHFFEILGAAVLLCSCGARCCFAQEQGTGTAEKQVGSEKQSSATKTERLGDANLPGSAPGGARAGLLGRLVDDQRRIWTSPAHLQFSDAAWLVPLGGFTAGLMITDADFSRHLSHNPTTISDYKTISNASLGTLVGAGAGMWLLGHVRRNEHWSETGFLAGESALNSLIVIEGMKYSLRRARPYQGNGDGSFFQSGGTSFPSAHAAAAWSVAGVIAHEYPGPLTKIMAYSLASLVDISRVRARQHFPSDVLIGTVIGNLVAQNIYSHHRDRDLGGGQWKSISELVRHEKDVPPSSAGTTYVPLDSWVYPALDRLAALGYVKTQFLGMRPWTRLECAVLAQSAGDNIYGGDSDPGGPYGLVQELESEFASELAMLGGVSNRRIRLQSVYTRLMGISGSPLTDSYHFGQTLINDFGRPYQEGFNNSTGFSGYATTGRYSIYVQGEYQHAPAGPAYALPVRQAISIADQNPLLPAQPVPGVDQYRLLDTYVGVNLESWLLTFGKQSLWWGSGEGGSLLFSNNAEPIYMFRASRVTPFLLPWILRWLGPMKIDLFCGKLSGNDFPPRPFIHGEKISFKPTRDLELGLARTSEFGGVGRPLTSAAVFNSYFGLEASGSYASNANPGKRTAGFTFSYNVPRLRKRLTLYADMLLPESDFFNVDTNPSPIYFYRRIAVRSGIYLPRLPLVHKLDLRVESVFTDPPTARSREGKYAYWDYYYHDLYTNKGNIIGDWIGREGVGYQAWSKYWFNAKNTLEFRFRHSKVDGDFIPGGETVNDGSVKLDYWVRRDLSLSTFVQYEQWKAPILAPSLQKNWTSSVEITFWPRSSKR